MEPTQCHPVPAAKIYPSKFKLPRKVSEAPKPTVKEPPNSRQKRVFGTTRNTNVPTKPIHPKPASKPSFPVLQNPPKSTCTSRPASSTTAKSTDKVAEKKTQENSKQKCVNIKGEVIKKPESSSPGENGVEARTPVKLALPSKLNKSCTPYYSAEKCSNCRFDKLETSSYWLSQINLAESVAKHFVSAAFFRLAQESNAEPSRNLWLELKRYLTRHEHVLAHTEWKDLSLSFGLQKAGGAENSSKED